MRRLLPLLFVTTLGVSLAAPAFARRVVVVHKNPHRTTVVVHRGWPLARPARVVVVSPNMVTVRVQPRVYLRPVVWRTTAVAVVASHPTADALSWMDGATLATAVDLHTTGRR